MAHHFSPKNRLHQGPDGSRLSVLGLIVASCGGGGGGNSPPVAGRGDSPKDKSAELPSLLGGRVTTIAGLSAPAEGKGVKAPEIKSNDPKLRITGWRWEVSSDQTSWTPVGQGAVYSPSQSDVGKFLRLTVFFSGSDGQSRTLSTSSTESIKDIDDAPTAFALDTSSVTLDVGTNKAVKLSDITFTDEDTNPAFRNNVATFPASDIFEIRDGASHAAHHFCTKCRALAGITGQFCACDWIQSLR